MSIINGVSNASSDLDPFPTALLKKCFSALLPIITAIVNLSLRTGSFPDTLKNALVHPLLKKSTRDPNDLKNYRTVSNIPFISKVIEKAVVKRIDAYMSSNDFHEKYKYRVSHGTETALVKIHDVHWMINVVLFL